jgi:hypothetical protein
MLAARERRRPHRTGPPSHRLRVSTLEPAGPLTERDLAHLWEGQRFPPEALTTTAGRPLRVLYRGRWGGGPGPDFRDAVIEAPWGTLKGDVELHVRASDFRRHGHHHDPAYNRLALHLVFWPDEEEDTALASGRRVPVAALAPWVERREEEIHRWLERPALWLEPCRGAPRRRGEEAVAAVLDRLGDIRFRRRTAELRRALAREDGDEVLYRALLEALGYGGNREAFRQLAQRLPWRALRGLLLNVPAPERAAAALEVLAEAARWPLPLAWRTAGLRPGNHPARRLEAAAHLAARYAGAGLAQGLRPLLDGEATRAVAALTVREWGRTLVGAGRAVEMLTNALLPFFAAGMEPRPGRAMELYRALPRPAAYGAVRHLDEAVGRAVRVDARRQQGMLLLLRHYCSQGRCGSCPLS